MGLISNTKQAFLKAVQRGNGKLVRLQEQTGVSYSAINSLNSGQREFKNMTLQTFERLFPEMEVSFFRDERRDDACIVSTDPLLREVLTNWDNLSRGDKHRMLTQLYDCLEGETPSSRVPPEEAPAGRTSAKHRKAG
ncbi:MAG: hypothetical protein L3J71_03615 [Victivallaceae bacterium]|nr:hypothetical protein [Victivallaceae bacterium]